MNNLYQKIKMSIGFGKASEQLSEALDQVKKEKDLDPEAVKMMEAVLRLSNQRVRDVMVPRANMNVILHTDNYQKALAKVLAAKHSRYPIISDNKDEIVGILLAKSLLVYQKDNQEPPKDITELCLPASFVPESKRLDSLLKEFKNNHTHMAIVMDEYGGVAGLITLEDVIEEITGEIEDEDFEDENLVLVKQTKEGVYLISGLATLEEINQTLETNLKSDTLDTFGGYIAQHLGYFPKPKQEFEISGLSCKIEHSDDKRIRFVRVTKNETSNIETQ